MALSINKTKISDTAWGDVDKTALGNRLASAYAAGDATKAQIKFVYLYVPDDAFGKDADGKPIFAYTKAKMPVCQVIGNEIVVNRNGVHAAAGAHGIQGADMPAAAMTAAKRRMRGLYRKLKETPPDALKESVQQLGRGKELTELVKGSLEYTREMIRDAFADTFKVRSPSTGDMYCPWHIEDTFADYVVVRQWDDDELAPDEYYKVTYTRTGDTFTFADEANWTIVELTYQPQTAPQAGGGMSDSKPGKGKNGAKRFVETIDAGQVELVESETEQNAKPDGPWRIKAIGSTADVVNENGRRYSAAVIAAAVNELRGHLHESAGQGRLLNGGVTGEPDHPRDKGNRRPMLLETVVNWDTVTFDSKHVLIEGNLLGTSKGKDIRAQMRGGLIPGISQRSYGNSVIVSENGESIEEVTVMSIKGYDLTLPFEQSDADSGVTMFETRQGEAGEHAGSPQRSPQQENDDMTKEELEKWVKEHPDLFKGIAADEIAKMGAEQLKTLEETIRKTLGIDDKADLGKELSEAVAAKKELTERRRIESRDKAIEEAVKDLKYGKLDEAFKGELAEMAKDGDGSNVKALTESLRKRYDAMLAQAKLAGMGYRSDGVQVLGPTIETQAGVPEFARAAFEMTERMVRSGVAQQRDFHTKPALNRNELFAKQYLGRFDKLYGGYLLQESKQLEEAEQTTDLNLPYSVSRAITAESMPQLVATSVFDVGVTDQSPMRLYFERFSGESGYAVTITDESLAAWTALDAWVALVGSHLTPGTVVVTSDPAGTTYDEADDYVVDYLGGRIMFLSTGSIGAGDNLLVDYVYSAIRKGEMAPIERGKLTLAYVTLETAADRLAEQISDESVVFGRSQLGWDATARTLTSLIAQIRRKIDGGLFYLALAAALRVADNNGGSWSSAGTDYDVFVRAVGAAKVKVSGPGRYYQPDFLLLSDTNADLIANWEGFTQAGSRPDSALDGLNGFVGKLKSLPTFHTTEFNDGFGVVGNREVVQHRVFKPMRLDGPHKSRDATTGKLIAAEEWYAEEYSGSETPVPEKAAYVTIS